MSKDNSSESRFSHEKASALLSKKLGGASRQLADVFKKKAHEIASNEKLRQGVNRQITNAGILSEKIKVVSYNVASAIKEKSNEIAASNMVIQEINQRLTDSETPEFIRQFLHTYWSKLLLKIYLKQGKDNNAWKQSLLVVEDLAKLINTRYFISGTDRVLKMDYLIQRVKNGMSIMTLSKDIQEQFVRQITAYDKYLVNKARKIQSAQSPNSRSTADFSSQDTKNVASQPFGNELLVDKIEKPRQSKSTPDVKTAKPSPAAGSSNWPLSKTPHVERKGKPLAASNPYYVKPSTSSSVISSGDKPAKAKPAISSKPKSKSKKSPSQKNGDTPFVNELLVDSKDKS